jgi:predicted dehydrogenase
MIGAGKIVQVGHIPNFQSIPTVTVEALCDVNEARVKALAAERNIPRTFTDYQTMLAEVKPDITVIATPNIFHKPMALAALQVGSNVLCEKPLALTYADAKEMFELAAAQGLTLNVGSLSRCDPRRQGPG